MAIAGGAHGLGFWPGTGRSARRSRVARDIARLGPATYIPNLAATATRASCFSSPGTVGGALYVIAINPTYHSLDATMHQSLLNGRTLNVLGEGRKCARSRRLRRQFRAARRAHLLRRPAKSTTPNQRGAGGVISRVLALAASLLALAAPLPDLDQAAPLGLAVVPRHSRLLLVFGSAVDNVGPGALVVAGRRVGNKMRTGKSVARVAMRSPFASATSVRRRTSTGTSRTSSATSFGGSTDARQPRPQDRVLPARSYETRPLNRSPVWTGQCAARRAQRDQRLRGDLARLRRRLRPAEGRPVDRRHAVPPGALHAHPHREPGSGPA